MPEIAHNFFEKFQTFKMGTDTSAYNLFIHSIFNKYLLQNVFLSLRNPISASTETQACFSCAGRRPVFLSFFFFFLDFLFIYLTQRER